MVEWVPCYWLTKSFFMIWLMVPRENSKPYLFPTDYFACKLSAILNQPGFVADILMATENKTGVKRLYLAYGFIAVITVSLAFGFGAQLLSNLIGIPYPVFCSIKALKTLDKQEDKKWFTYWVIFTFSSFLDFFTDILVEWIPYYWLTKTLFIIWCMAPMENNGSQMIYAWGIQPFFQNQQPQVDILIEKKAKAKAGDFIDKELEKLTLDKSPVLNYQQTPSWGQSSNKRQETFTRTYHIINVSGSGFGSGNCS